jgi:hypothetical protein
LDTAEIERIGDEVSDTKFTAGNLVSADAARTRASWR